MFGPNQIGQVFADSGYGYDQADVNAIGFNENGNAIAGLLPIGVGGDEASQ